MSKREKLTWEGFVKENDKNVTLSQVSIVLSRFLRENFYGGLEFEPGQIQVKMRTQTGITIGKVICFYDNRKMCYSEYWESTGAARITQMCVISFL